MVRLVAHVLLIFATAAAPFLCCGNGVPRAQRDGCCDACDTDCGQDADRTGCSSPVRHGRDCCELCQCVCAGAVLEPHRVEASPEGRFQSLSDQTVLLAGGSGISTPGGLGRLIRDPPFAVFGRSMRERYQSFLC